MQTKDGRVFRWNEQLHTYVVPTTPQEYATFKGLDWIIDNGYADYIKSLDKVIDGEWYESPPKPQEVLQISEKASGSDE